MANYRQIFKSTGLLGSVQVLYVLIAVLRNKIAAQFIGPAGIGLADLYGRTMDLMGNATNFGLGLSAVRCLSEVFNTENAQAEARHAQNATAPESPHTPAAAGLSPIAFPQSTHQVRLIRTWVLLSAILGVIVTLCLSPLISRAATGSADYTLSFCLLAPMVGFTTLMGGEMAILKATRRLKRLAFASACGAVATLAVSAPLYIFCGMRGIVPTLLITSAAMFAFNLRESKRIFPYRTGPFQKGFIKKGLPLVKLGTAYIMAGIMTSGAEMLIRAGIATRSPLGFAETGFYTAGFTLTVSYARMIFVAMDADFYPRLSTVAADRRAMNLHINRQINTLIVLMAPFLLLFCAFLPLIIRLLYTAQFLVIIPMVLCAAPCMFFKAVYTPIAYIPLARGDSFVYMTMELIYDMVLCLTVIGGYLLYGLAGAGMGLAAAHLFDFVMVHLVYARHYGYRMNRTTSLRVVALLVLLMAGLYAVSLTDPAHRIIAITCTLALMLPAVWPVLKRIRRKG